MKLDKLNISNTKESIFPDSVEIYNTGPSVLDTPCSDSSICIYNTSADAKSPVLDTVSRTESLAFTNV